MPYPTFDRSRLRLRPLAERRHDMTLDHLLDLGALVPQASPRLDAIADRIGAARAAGRPVILMMGAHVIKSGVSRHVIDLVGRGLVTHIAMNGAGPIHDFELALIGATTESVARYISAGQFGLWQETGRINDLICAGAAEGLGIGEALGRAIGGKEHVGAMKQQPVRWPIRSGRRRIEPLEHVCGHTDSYCRLQIADCR